MRRVEKNGGCRLALLFVVWILLAFVHVPAVVALELPYGECRVGYWSSTRNLDDSEDVYQGLCFAHWKPAFSDNFSIGFNAQTHVANIHEDTGDEFRLREGYINYSGDEWSFRLGRQIIAWGKADRINPTDYFSARDFTLLVAEDEDQRKGVDAAMLQFTPDFSNRVTLVVADFESHDIPDGLIPSMIRYHLKPNGYEVAVKYERTSDFFDWSVSYYDGYDHYRHYWFEPDLSLFGVWGAYEDVRNLGFDAAFSLEEWTFRGEFTRGRKSNSASSEKKHDFTRAIVGADVNFLESANLNIQYFVNRREQLSAGLDPDSIVMLGLERLNSEFGCCDRGVTIRLSNQFFNEQLKAEISFIRDVVNRSSITKPRLYYTLNDSVRASLGADLHSGRTQSLFGSRKKNDVIFIEVTTFLGQ